MKNQALELLAEAGEPDHNTKCARGTYGRASSPVNARSCAKLAGRINYMAAYVRGGRAHVYSFIRTLYGDQARLANEVACERNLHKPSGVTDTSGTQGDPFAVCESNFKGHTRSRTVNIRPTADIWKKGATVELRPDAIADICWWLANIDKANGVRMYLTGPIKGLWRHHRT